MRRMIEDAGALLARLHSVETAGYGHLDSLGRGAAPTLEGWWFLDAGGYGPSLVKNGLEELVDVVAQRLLDVRTQFAGPRCLVHGDFGPKHVFVDEDDRIVGIIDFGNVQSGDATFDLAPWGFWWDKHIPLEWLIAGYTRATELGDRFEERMRLARLIHLVGTTVYFTEQAPFPYWATESAKAIRELVGQR
jgi:aminoglycoside phosphotransferase (APT) family kinase protein